MPPFWKETFWPLEWMTLRLSPAYFGIGLPRGDGSPVVLVPGFLSADVSLVELYLWLKRMGYRPYMSGIRFNAECPGKLTEKLVRTSERAYAETGRPVRIIGHSLGGVIGRRACVERTELFSQLICLGTPVQAVNAHPAIGAVLSLMRLAMNTVRSGSPDCLTDLCECAFLRRLIETLPAGVRRAAIYTRDDGVVDWRDALELDPDLNYEVGGTHTGLVYNARAYKVLATLLAGAGDSERLAA